METLDLTRLVGALVLTAALLGLFYLCLKMWRSRVPGQPNTGKELIHQETLYLDSRTKLHVVSYQGQKLLIANGPNGPTLLTTAAESKKS